MGLAGFEVPLCVSPREISHCWSHGPIPQGKVTHITQKMGLFDDLRPSASTWASLYLLVSVGARVSGSESISKQSIIYHGMDLAEFEVPLCVSPREISHCWSQGPIPQGKVTHITQKMGPFANLRPRANTWASPYLWVSVGRRSVVQNLSRNCQLSATEWAILSLLLRISNKNKI